jgi:hypothetical protein
VVGGGQDDAFFHLGEYIHSNAYVHEGEKYWNEKINVVQPLCQLVRMELTLVIERMMWWCYLMSKQCNIVRESKWGLIHEEHQAL